MSKPAHRKLNLIHLTLLIICLLPMMVSGQEVRKIVSAEGLVELPEVGALIIGDEDGPRIMALAPASARLEQYRAVDLQESDLIVSANGTRTADAAALSEVVNSLEPGDTLRLAVQRQGRFAVATIVIGTEEVREAAQAAADEYMAANPEESGGTVQRRVVRITADDDAAPWVDLAVMITNSPEGVKVTEQIGMPLFTKEQVQLEAGDIIVALDERDISTSAELIGAYGDYHVGDLVNVTILRGGEEQTISFTKPELPGAVKVMKE